jgi:hypothetical protein
MKIINYTFNRGHRAPNTFNVLSNLARIRTLELGKLRRASGLEVYLVSRGRDELNRGTEIQ